MDHVRANQSRFLGAVHTVVSEWIKQGKPRTSETRHDFRKWAAILDWIMTKIFNRPGMLDGHRELQNRVSTPIAGILREMAIEANKAGRLNQEMGASEIIAFAAEVGIDIPGLKGQNEDRRAQ